ncbi:peptidase [Aliterella atlantica]|uniref:peptidase n=1 Tax=Aliterella atlantica TaxID=1827278 RepID=UPI000908095E|nr:peptidase [Aliterella atlantica]
MNRLFRKYHRQLAIVCALPLLLTVITGMLFPIAKGFHQRQLAGFLIHLHTLKTIGLDSFFPIINGIGLLGLLVTGIYMTSLFRERRFPSNPHDL